MNRKVLLSLLVIGVAALMAGLGTSALFTDSATSEGNTFTAGTLTLKVGDGGVVQSVNVGNMKPGDISGYHKWVLKNTGSLPGRISATFGDIVNYDNGTNGPEQQAKEAMQALYGPPASGDPGPGLGHLGQYLKTGQLSTLDRDDITILERNDEEGWYIVSVDEDEDIGSSFGWGPVGWSVPSQIIGVWSTGPTHPWGTPGLNGLANKKYTANATLQPGQEVAFFLRVSLDENLRRWDGTQWIDDVNDNIIQSDSVEFNITFMLEQLQ